MWKRRDGERGVRKVLREGKFWKQACGEGYVEGCSRVKAGTESREENSEAVRSMRWASSKNNTHVLLLILKYSLRSVQIEMLYSGL